MGAPKKASQSTNRSLPSQALFACNDPPDKRLFFYRLISSFMARPRNVHRVARPVRTDRKLDVISLACLCWIRNELVRGVVLRVGPHILVHLVHGLNRFAAFQ